VNRAFAITHELGSTTCVVGLAGDLDMAVVPELREDLDSALESGCVNLVLDLTRVTYADSSALGLLVWLNNRLSAIDGKVMLAGANRDVSRILELSGLVGVAGSIGVSANVDAAVEGLELPPVSTDLLWRQSLQIDADVNQLAGVREQLGDWIEPLGFPESAQFDIKVALGEALANAVRHGQPVHGAATVDVAVCAYEDRLCIEVSDQGVGFDGVHRSDEDIYAPSGRGIMFMRALMDRVDFAPGPGGGTIVRLVKHRRGGAA
jgi:anti-anti-sigma factor